MSWHNVVKNMLERRDLEIKRLNRVIDKMNCHMSQKDKAFYGEVEQYRIRESEYQKVIHWLNQLNKRCY